MKKRECLCPNCNCMAFKYIGDTHLNIQIKCRKCKEIVNIHKTYIFQ